MKTAAFTAIEAKRLEHVRHGRWWPVSGGPICTSKGKDRPEPVTRVMSHKVHALVEIDHQMCPGIPSAGLRRSVSLHGIALMPCDDSGGVAYVP